MVRMMHLPSVKLLDEGSLVKRRTVIGLVVLMTLVPSVYLAVKLVQKEWFAVNSTRYIQEELAEAQKLAASQLPLHAIYREIVAQFPQSLQLSVSAGYRTAENRADRPDESAAGHPLLLVQLTLPSPLSAAETQRLRQGLRVRAGLQNTDDVQLLVSSAVAKKGKARAAKQ